MRLTGTPASSGIAIGKILKLVEEELVVEKKQVQDPEAEIQRFQSAITQSEEQLTKLREITLTKFGEEEAKIFDAHLLILKDPEISQSTENSIKSDSVNADYALNAVVGNFITIFESMDDEYMRERAADLKDVFKRVTRNILGVASKNISELEDEVVIVADDLTPSQIASIDKDKVLGFLTNKGGKTSHTAIMARALEIPAIVGFSNITELTNDEDMIALNATSGEAVLNPPEQTLNDYLRLKETELAKKAELKKMVGLESETKDGRKIELAGNIGTALDIDSLHDNDATSVGLYRTEFLFMDRTSMPTEDEQYEAYKTIIEKLNGKSCTIRTLDIGGDKDLPYLNIPKEENPFLGYRAIRICLDDTSIFKTQLRAILRASAHGEFSIMFPMISSVEELLKAKDILKECMGELERENTSFDAGIKIGMMIEVPSAAILSDIFAKHVDFFSMGTNDLTQYTCAVDRVNEKVEHLYDPFNPGLLRLIKLVSENANKENISVSICGSMAHTEELIPFYIACGIQKLSMSPVHVLPTKKLIRELDSNQCENILNKINQLSSASEIREYLKENV